ESAAGRSREPTRRRGTGSRSPPTSATATRSTAPWRLSPRLTPTRTNGTTAPCKRQWRPAVSRPRWAFDRHVLRGLINHVPIWLLLILVVGAIVGLIFGLVWLIRRLVPLTREGFDAEVSSQIL